MLLRNHSLKACSLLLLGGLLGACGGGDEYEGFDATVSQDTPDQFLTFFNRQAELPAGTYTLVVATNAAGQAGTFSVSIQRNDGSATQVINGSWVSSGGLDPDRNCVSGNRCYAISLPDAGGATFTLTSALDGVLYLVDDSDTQQVVETANANGAGGAETLTYARSNIDENRFVSAYYAAVDPMNARDTAQKYVALHGLNNPDVHVIFRDSKDLGYGRDMFMVSYPNPSACGGQMIVFYVRNFSVKIVDGFAYGPVNLEAAIAEDLQHHIGTNAIEFGNGRADVGDPCSPEPMAKFYTFEPNYNPPNAPHPRRERVDLDARGAKAMPQPCISCHGGKLQPLDRFGRLVGMHADDNPLQFGDTKARMQAFEVDTFEFSDQVGHRRIDVEDKLRRLNAAIYCTYPGSLGHPACDAHTGGGPGTGGVVAQPSPGEWSGDFGREMMLGWYGNALETPGSSFSDQFVPPGWTPSPGGAPVGADALFRKVIGPNCFVCHGKRGTELGTENDAGGDGKDLDFRSWDKFISHADEIERLVYDEGKMPLGLLNFQNFWGDPEKAELLASFIAPYVTNSAGFGARRTDSSGNILEPGSRVIARAGPDRVTDINAPISLNAQASLFADTYSWQVTSSPPGSIPLLSNPSGMHTNFTANVVGNYTVRLTASSSETGSSRTDSLTILVDNSLAKAPRDLTFYTDISAELATCGGLCHSSTGINGVPVWWVADANQPGGAGIGNPLATPALGWYEQARARVNFEFIEDSLLLKKPSGVHHYGGQQAINLGYDTTLPVGALGRINYDMFVNWIAEGAPCGMVGPECP